MQISGRFVGNGLDRSVRFTRYIVIRVAARAAYMPPLRMTRYVVATVKPRAGHAPPLRGDGFVYSNVGRGDPTPPGRLVIDAKWQGGVKTPPYE